MNVYIRRPDDAGVLFHDPAITSTAMKILIAEIDMDDPVNRYVCVCVCVCTYVTQLTGVCVCVCVYVHM